MQFILFLDGLNLLLNGGFNTGSDRAVASSSEQLIHSPFQILNLPLCKHLFRFYFLILFF